MKINTMASAIRISTRRWIIIAALVSGVASQVKAQEGSSFGAFVAVPVGNFKSTDLRNGGFAKTGWGIVFDSKSHFKSMPDNLFLYFHSTYQWNEMDTEALAAAFTKELGKRTTITESRYSPLLTTLGPSYVFDLTDKLKLALNGTVGIMFNNTRSLGIRVYDDNDTELLREAVSFDNNVAFAYTLGVELRFPLFKDLIGGAVYVDYTGAKQKTTLTFDTLDPIKSFEQLQYLNCGFKFTLPKH